MKKMLQHIAVISITLLYCLATSLCSGLSYKAQAAIATEKNSKACFSAGQFSKSFQHTVQPENSYTVCSHHNTVNFKNTFREFYVANMATEHVLMHIFTRYNFFSNNLLVRLQNTDLIFPFQYFW